MVAPGWFSLHIVAIWVISILQSSKRKAQKKREMEAALSRERKTPREDLFKSIIFEQPAQTEEPTLAHDEDLDWYHDKIAELEKQNEKLKKKLSHLNRLMDQRNHNAALSKMDPKDQAEVAWLTPKHLGRDMVTRIILGPPKALARRQISVD